MALVKQELQSARRTRYVIFTFVLMPLFMWGLQGGLQMLMGFVMGSSQEGVTIYYVSYDEGIEINETHTYKLSETFLEMLENATQTNNSILYGAKINSTKYADLPYSILMERINSSETVSYYTPCIILHANFTQAYLEYNATSTNGTVPPVIELYSLPSGILGSTMLEAGIATIIYQPPFTYHVATDKDKLVLFSSRPVIFEKEEGAASGFGVGFIGMISIMVAVLAPAPFVSTSFAGEREKKTMESLLALPISRFNILFSKLLAGMVLVGIFALMNVIGVFLFSGMIDVASESIGAEEYSSIFAIDTSPTMLVLIVAMMFLSAFVAIGIGISLASLTKDVRSAESMYNIFMMVPAMGVGFIGMFGGIPEQAFGGAGVVLYIIPWAHSIAILSKGLYPKTYASSALTRNLPFGGIPMDLVLHFGYLIIVILICLFIASKVFEREGILT
jgi:ABC-type transport system involved in multi-copper enzyme maturation permease subunit